MDICAKESGTMIRNRKSRNYAYTSLTETYAVELPVSCPDMAPIRRVKTAAAQIENSKSGDQDIWKIVKTVLTVQMRPKQVIAGLSAEFHDTLNTTQIEMCVNRIEAAIKQAHTDVTTPFLKPQTAESWQRRT